jgi:hypothetical protein
VNAPNANAERDISRIIETLPASEWQLPSGANSAPATVEALEDGKVLFFPRLAFALTEAEKRFLDPAFVGPKAKNIAFDARARAVKHAAGSEADIAAIAAMMKRYYEAALSLVSSAVPHYAAALETGRTSFRPVEISGRATSRRQDDTLLHVDAFPTSPVADRRILRVFSNVNPGSKTRYWRLGAPFPEVAGRFFARTPSAIPGSAWLMKSVGLTKAYRTPYDHMMLAVHDAMKRDPAYQRDVTQNEFHFPPGSTWIVYTDQVSHAAMSGQHMFEQTFYLPVQAMADEGKSPLRVLEGLAGRRLV